ncbi:hypothetical protein [Mucilaginibacter lacusdianchii]|uniref:hypothetical protein n=1 Tax=Mucilaginibacter lacusdianchii TaxID=2684211 RepID=UPI00131AA5C7|nr:hypothetical protein [Mucilaginibacter sp. JXJ CY 39]
MLRSLKLKAYTLRQYIAGIKTYINYSKALEKGVSKKSIFIDIQSNVYNRYLYTLLKFLKLEGFTIYLPKKFSLVNQISKELYASYILKDKLVIFKDLVNIKERSNLITIGRDVLSANYFESLLKQQQKRKSYYIPISQHPALYYKNLWNIPIDRSQERINSILLLGNFDKQLYSKISHDGVFNILSRIEVLNVIENTCLNTEVHGLEDLNIYLAKSPNSEVVIIKSNEKGIPAEALRSTLVKFNYFFAVPGVVMPFSHNIVEAMSVGCIPILQDTYAQLFSPPLKHHINALIFKDKDDLSDLISYAFNLSENEIAILRKNVDDYYSHYLTPHAVVSMLLRDKHEHVFLQAEHHSVNLVKKM